MEWGAVFLATIIAAIIGTLVMGLVANVPYAQAPGMGLNAFFVYTVCFGLGFTWQQALSMVFICGVLNILITVTKLRKYIIKCIPRSLQHAIGGGIGLFISYIGLLNVGFIKFDSGVPALATFNDPQLWLFLIGLALTIVLLVRKVPGAILIGIVIATVVGIPMGVTTMADTVSFREACAALPTTVGVIFTPAGLPSLFADMTKLPMVLITILAFSVSDTFDTIGAFIGTGIQSGIFSEEDEKTMENSSGFKSKMDKALFADAAATSIGALFGTSNTTTYVESAAGIAAGGRTGLTSVVVAVCFALSAFLAAFVSAIPYAATAPALVSVGVMMTSAFKEINWEDFEEAVPAFFRQSVHDAVLQHLGRHRIWFYHLLSGKNLQKRSRRGSSDPLGGHIFVHIKFCTADVYIKLPDTGKYFEGPQAPLFIDNFEKILRLSGYSPCIRWPDGS